MSSGVRNDLGLTALLVGGVLVALLLAEAAARVLTPGGGAHMTFDAAESEPAGLYAPDDTTGMVLQPGFEGQMKGPGNRVTIRTNSLGLRGDELGPPREAVDRWLVIGDSFAFSAQVPESATFEAHLAQRLDAEVLNAGVNGYSTWQATDLYRKLAPDVQPDGVALVFFLGNDLFENLMRVPRFHSERADTGPTAVGLRTRINRLVSSHSFLYAHLRVLQRQRAIRSGAYPALRRWKQELSAYTKSGAADLAEMENSTREALEGLRDAAAVRGDRVIVAIAPPVFQVDTARAGPTLELVGLDPSDQDLDAPRRTALTLLEDAGIPHCDLTPSLREAQARGVETYLRFDGHWSEEGHEVVAETMHACITGR